MLLILFAWMGCALPSASRAFDATELISQMAHTSWGAKEGIIDVQSIAQTRDGYLWIATREGLLRFDGTTFEPIQLPPLEREAGESPAVLCATREGGLWLGAGGTAVHFFNGTTSIFNFTNGLPDGEITSMVEDSSGTIWMGTSAGLANFSKGQWQHFGEEHGIPPGRVRAELEDEQMRLWITADDPAVVGGTLIGSLDRSSNRFEMGTEHFGSVTMLGRALDGQIWVAESSRTVRPLASGSAGNAISLSAAAILFDRHGAIWLGTAGKGLVRISGFSGRETGENESGLRKDQFTEKDGLRSDFISCLFEDSEGNVWAGSGNGLEMFRSNKILSYSIAEGLSFDQRLALAAGSKGSIWAGSEQGLMRIRSAKDIGDQDAAITRMATGAISSFHVSATGNVWIGDLNGISRITESGPQAVEIGGGIELRNITAITEDAEGGVWLCDELRGVCRLIHDKIRVFPPGPNLSGAVVNVAMTDAQGDVWLGFQDGSISRYRAGKFESYRAPQSVLALQQDRHGTIWAGGAGGISRFDEKEFRTLTVRNGLPGSELSAIIEDNDGYFWLAGRSAILRVHPRELSKALADPAYAIRTDSYGTDDGLRGLPRQGRPLPVAVRAKDGRLWFATTAGLSIVDPQRFKAASETPPVYILRATVDGKEIEARDRARLPAHTRDLKIDFTAVSFSNPQKILFRHQLKGYDETWHEAGALRHASYANLPPRQYQFHVMASNADGVWAQSGPVWTFSIEPAFYQTHWFYLLAMGTLCAAVWGAYRWNLIRVTRQTETRMNAQMEAQMAERKRIAQELHDTLLQGFTGVRLKLWAISKRLMDSPKLAEEQLKQVIDQADKCLADSRRSVWELRLPRLEDADLATAMAAMLQDLVAGTPLHLNFKTSGSPERLSDIVEYNVLRIAEAAVANVIQHAQAKNVDVELRFQNRKVTLTIRDDGIGFDPGCVKSRAGNHFGLEGMRERAHMMGATLVIQSRPGAPTLVTITVG